MTAQSDQAQTDRHWLQVGEFVANFGGNELPSEGILAGRSVQLNYEDGSSEKYRFINGERLELTGTAGLVEVPYRATQLRPDILLLDYLEHGNSQHSVSIVLDLGRKACTKVLGELPTREETLIPLYTRVLNQKGLSPVRARFVHGTIDTPWTSNAYRHAPTDELTGQRVYHEYGADDGYEHIYLESDLYTWHCIKGPEVGLADTDKCFIYKLDQQLYLFVWIEKIIPTIGVLMMDFAALRTTGKLFGYRGSDFGETVNSAVGAVSQHKNITHYPR